MTADLGEFEDHPVNGMTIVLNTKGGALNRAVDVHAERIVKGQKVRLLIDATAEGVHFDPDKDDDDGWIRCQRLKVETVAFVTPEFGAAQIEAQKLAEEKAKGVVRIPFGEPLDKGPRVVTDANGVVLTEAEVAERRGQLADVNGPDPMVVEFLLHPLDELKRQIKKSVAAPFLRTVMDQERQGEDRGTVLNLLEKRIGELS